VLLMLSLASFRRLALAAPALTKWTPAFQAELYRSSALPHLRSSSRGLPWPHLSENSNYSWTKREDAAQLPSESAEDTKAPLLSLAGPARRFMNLAILDRLGPACRPPLKIAKRSKQLLFSARVAKVLFTGRREVPIVDAARRSPFVGPI
jgi:hypothetical protein